MPTGASSRKQTRYIPQRKRECAFKPPLPRKNMTYFGGWRLKNNKIYVYDIQGNRQYFSPAFLVAQKFKDVSSGAYVLEIEFLVGTHVEKVTVDRRLLAEKVLPVLVDKGFSLSPTLANEVTLCEILMEQENAVNLELCHTKLGYQLINGKHYYFGNEEISGSFVSTYIGNHSVQRSGAFCEWQAFVSQTLEENVLLALPMAMGVSAPIATRLKLAGVTDETLLWALIGASSTGKTTSLKLSASVWGMPSGDGIIDNLTGTEKYFFASLASREGYPNFFDETSAVNWDFTNAIYTVGLSREGGRCNPDGTPKKRKTWSGAVIFTGETSMFYRTNGNGGLHARLVEFDCAWFANEKQPEQVSRFVAKNYGTAWLPFMHYLQNVSNDYLMELYDSCVYELRREIALRAGFDDTTWETKKFSGICIRIIKKLAILLVATKMMLSAWQMSIDGSRILEYILDVYNHNVASVDKIDEFYEDFTQYITLHRNEFPTVTHSRWDSSTQSSAQGFQDHFKGRNCIWVLAEVFEKQLRKHGLGSSPNVLRELYRRNIIEHFGDRFKKNYKTGQLSPLCVCFYPNLAPPPSHRTSKNNKSKSSQLMSLLDNN